MARLPEATFMKIAPREPSQGEGNEGSRRIVRGEKSQRDSQCGGREQMGLRSTPPEPVGRS